MTAPFAHLLARLRIVCAACLLFGIAALISGASQTMPLLPGDILLTGSPAGNGQHWKRFLQDGDVMTGSISGLGTQVVRCVAAS